MTQEALKLALEHIEGNYTVSAEEAITAIKEALAQPEQEPMAWEQFYPDIGKPQIEQPKVRTGDCLLVGVCASEGHKIAPQRTWVRLEVEEIRNLWEEATKPDRRTMTMVTSFARAIESKLKQKNGYAKEKNT